MFILASASPRRRELLGGALRHFKVEPSLFAETAKGLSPYETVRTFARGKAEEVFSRFPEAFVLGADTVVSYGGEVLGKPKDREEAKRMLRLLSGKTHEVLTGVCLISKSFFEERVAVSRVRFFELSESLIEEYVNSGLPLDKAGAYGIQDGYPLVCSLEGSYSNVVGLPMEEVLPMYIRALGGDDD